MVRRGEATTADLVGLAVALLVSAAVAGLLFVTLVAITALLPLATFGWWLVRRFAPLRARRAGRPGTVRPLQARATLSEWPA